MTNRKIRMICMDLDGTLLKKDGSLHPENGAMIREAQRRGVLCVIASGRATGNALAKIWQAGLVCPVSAMNGTQLTDETGRVIASHPMSAEAAVGVERVLAAGKADYVLMGEKRISTSREDFYHHSELEYGPEMMEMGYVFLKGREKLRLEAEKGPVYKYYVCHMEDPERLSDRVAAVGGVTLTRSGRDNLEIMTAGCDKGTGIGELAALRGIGREEIMAAGDEMNDLPMIRYAGWGVAMGNADARVKAAASFVTASNEEAGVAEAIRLLIGEGRL